jgi:hypothetical protein
MVNSLHKQELSDVSNRYSSPADGKYFVVALNDPTTVYFHVSSSAA